MHYYRISAKRPGMDTIKAIVEPRLKAWLGLMANYGVADIIEAQRAAFKANPQG